MIVKDKIGLLFCDIEEEGGRALERKVVRLLERRSKPISRNFTSQAKT